jgi:MFS transporter, DHA1 family, multidrug resistance protein
LTPDAAAGPAPAGIDWRRNLAALWFAEFTAIFGFSFAFPFLPIYLKELGVTQPADLATISGYAAGASGFAMAIMSPIWGVVADRYGRKSMLVRAMVGGAITVGLLGFVVAPWQLIALRFLQGATSGTVAAATAIVASGSPRARVGWALGILSSSIAIGGAVGPLIGGLLAALIGVRHIFWVSGVMLLIATIPVVVIVREIPIDRRSAAVAQPAIATLRAAGAGTIGALVALLAAQGLSQMTYSAFQPLIVLRLLATAGSATSSLTGLTFGVAGVASAVAAVSYSKAVQWWGYRRVAIAAAIMLGAAELTVGLTSPLVLLVVGGGLAGLFYGALSPAISSMIGLEVPFSIQARVFGVSSSATALGFGIGPLLGGETAAFAGVQAGIAAAAILAWMTAVTLAAWAREPAR